MGPAILSPVLRGAVAGFSSPSPPPSSWRGPSWRSFSRTRCAAATPMACSPAGRRGQLRCPGYGSRDWGSMFTNRVCDGVLGGGGYPGVPRRPDAALCAFEAQACEVRTLSRAAAWTRRWSRFGRVHVRHTHPHYLQEVVYGPTSGARLCGRARGHHVLQGIVLEDRGPEVRPMQ